METKPQIFQTQSRWRWRTFQWTGRFLLFTLLLMIPVVIITLARGIKPDLPPLKGDQDPLHQLLHPVQPGTLNAKEQKKYKGFDAFLKARQLNEERRQNHTAVTGNEIRAAFYVDWDPQSFYSLQQHIDQLNLVIPEWFFIDPLTDTLRPDIDMAALQLMKQHHVRIVPLLNNINEDKGPGVFDGDLLHRILHNRSKQQRLISDIIKYLQQYGLQGINIDFEEFKETSDEPIIRFQQELYTQLHKAGLLVTQDIMPSDADFNIRELARFNDYMVLMAYDEHYSTSVPGPVSSQQWVEKVLDETAKDIPSAKIILGMAGYGYDWAKNQEAVTVTYQQALANARQYNVPVDFDNNTYSDHYRYTDGGHVTHDVYFNDAAAHFNTLRFADEYPLAGTALWRLGSEDERLWMFYHRSLTNASLREKPFDFHLLENADIKTDKPDYIGDGEVLNVVSVPGEGSIGLETDTAENIIAEQTYKKLPTRYVIQKYGNVHRQVILTFDDGPDPSYTPRILDILKKEKVPAVFFVVGMEAENHLPLLERIYKEGHEIGNHTFTHPNMAAVSAERAGTEMEATRLLIEAVTGRSTVLFRAPFNADAEPTKEVELKPVAASREKNYYTVGESIDPNDWEPGVTADSVYERVIRQYESNPSKGIILLHDAGGNREATVKALPRIIQYFKQKGIAFTTVADLLGVNKDMIMPPVHNSLVKLNSGIAVAGYWTEHFLSAAFWIAIILGLGRILLMAILALLQKIKSNQQRISLRTPATTFPGVSIIVPAYNEEVNVVRTLQNLLQQDYPVLEILFVDDGSKDNTLQCVQEKFSNDLRVTILSKPNGGKASALNYGIERAKHAFVVCIDADTQLMPDAVTQLMKKMLNNAVDQKPVGAVAGNVKVGNECTWLTRWQSIEYITAQNFDRRAYDLINAITVVPGAIGAFRKEAIQDAGGFTTDTLAEDCDLTIRLLRKGYRVVNCTEAIAVTEAPETIKQFMKQRFRWSYGIMQAFWKNKDACFNPRYGSLGMIALPNILLFQVLLPLFSPFADLMLILSLVWNRHNPESLQKIGLYYLLFLVVDLLVSFVAFRFEKEKLSKLLWLIPQRFVYRQLMYIILFRSLKKAIKGESQGWGVLKRTGSVKDVKWISG